MNQQEKIAIDQYASGFAAACQNLGVDPEEVYKQAAAGIKVPGSAIHAPVKNTAKQNKTVTTDQMTAKEPKTDPLKPEEAVSGTPYHHHNSPATGVEQKIVQASDYERGFIDKCAELGVDPDAVVKFAQTPEEGIWSQYKNQVRPQAMKNMYQSKIPKGATMDQLKTMRHEIQNPFSRMTSQLNNAVNGFGGGALKGFNNLAQTINPFTNVDKRMQNSSRLQNFGKGVANYTGGLISKDMATTGARWLTNPIGAAMNLGHNKLDQKATQLAHQGLPMGQPKRPLIAGKDLKQEFGMTNAPDKPIKTGPKIVGGGSNGVFSYRPESIRNTRTKGINSAGNNPTTGGSYK